MTKEPTPEPIFTEEQVRKALKWPWYSRFLLPFCKPITGLDFDGNYVCTVTVKKLFGRTYITKTECKEL